MPSATTHIPAWKRLGLKLKAANDDSIPDPSLEPIVDLKRKRAETEDASTRRKSKRTTKPLTEITGQDPITPSLGRKKSVTFTPETKVDDGDSIKQLFNSWVAEQKTQDPSFELKTSALVFTTPEPFKVEEEVDPALDEKGRRVKRVKKPKPEVAKPAKSKQKPSKVTKPTKATPPTAKPFLQYLRQYYESKETWKFNKNHQTHLLKHLFDINVVPSDHAQFVYAYVRGLQGTVRTRLRDETLAIKVKDSEEGFDDMADPDKAQREYERAMKEYVATKTAANLLTAEAGYEEGVLMGISDSAMKERVGKRLRAETVLENLGDIPVENGESLKRLRMNDGTSQKVARKRKQRTATEESSASESSSDSDDESSGEEDKTTQNDEDDSDSSSSSSSSSSGGSSGSGEDEEGDSSEESSESSSSEQSDSE